MGQFEELLILFIKRMQKTNKQKDTPCQNRSNVPLFKDDYSICEFSRNSEETQYVSTPNSA